MPLRKGNAGRRKGAPDFAAQGLRASDIDLLIAIEGRSPSAARAAAARVGSSPAALRSWIGRLKKRQVLRTVAIVDRARWRPTIESVVRIRVDWCHPGATALEAALRNDAAVTQAARTSGAFDYVAYASHDDHYEAAAWSRRLQAQPCVSGCQVDRIQTRFKRFASAATLLKPAAAQ